MDRSEPDLIPGLAWLGPAAPVGDERAGVERSVDAGADGLTLVRLRAERDLDGIATGSLLDVSHGWRFEPAKRPPGSWPHGLRAIGFQLAEFAFPARADDDLVRWRPLLPHRPASVLPVLLLGPDGRCVLLGPLDSFHEQVLAVDDGETLRWGWHGDLDEVPAGFTTTLAVVTATGPRAALARWGELVRDGAEVSRPADPLGTQLSYWTDNGAAYWYRTEPGHDVISGLAATVADLRDRGMPVGPVQLDSWWYPHAELRPFDTDDWVVPPSGLVSWTPRPDILPDGIEPLRAALGAPPLVAHCRHLSSASPLVGEHECWVDGDRAHPAGRDLYERWLDDARAWGIETFEHDWLVECFLGVRGLRAEAGRAAAWQAGIDDAAAARDMTLQWCMASPADMATAARLPRVTSVRTSGDHGYITGPGFLWGWFLVVNALARALGLRPFKDVFHAGSGDHAELEALLSSLSGGPVGLGDRLGAANPSVVTPCCRADGVLVGPDEPVAAIDRCFARWPSMRPMLLAGDAVTRHAGAGEWIDAVAINPAEDGDERVVGTIGLEELGITDARSVVAWDRHAGKLVDVADGWSVDLGRHEWSSLTIAPVLAGWIAVVGDVDRYVPAGRARIAAVAVDAASGAVTVEVAGAAGERVRLAGWAARPPAEVDEWDASTGEWHTGVTLPANGRTSIAIT